MPIGARGDELSVLLIDLVRLLARHGEVEFSASFDGMRQRWDSVADDREASSAFLRTLLQLYRGGMGSFNDLVLHDGNGTMLLAPNDQLDALRRAVYNEAVQQLTSRL